MSAESGLRNEIKQAIASVESLLKKHSAKHSQLQVKSKMDSSVRAPSGQGPDNRGRNLGKEVKPKLNNLKTMPASPMKQAPLKRADSNKANAGGER